MNRFRQVRIPADPILDYTIQATSSYPWYGVVVGDEIAQGDIFENCPVFFPPDVIHENSATSLFTYGKLDLIVMSQSCDLEKGREKVEQVSLCVVLNKSKFRSGNQPVASGTLEEIRQGRKLRYHMIASSNVSEFKNDIRIVDLQQIYSLPISFLRARAAKEKHLRLLPPYREHLSQSFARVFMRVGLPIDIPKFTKN
jgi:hypothetical protein